jgi:uncharacterized damage-inducible protein DinB
MNADDLRHFLNYHLAENRATWDNYILPLPQEQFVQPVEYSIGSVRNQLVHLMSVDNIWFSELRGLDGPAYFNPDDFNDRTVLRAQWDAIEQIMSDYIVKLTDEMLSQKPYGGGEDKDLIVWQILLHVVNHGTDHRAQLLRILHDFGVKTVSQDYIFYVYDHPM